MWLVLCSNRDTAGLWAHQELQQRLGPGVTLVTQETLAGARRWAHWLEDGSVGFEVELSDGRRVESRSTRGALNRMTHCVPPHLSLVSGGDRNYAQQEFQALLLSLLEALPEPCLGRPSAQGLSGAWRHPSEWCWRAADAGLPVRPYRLGVDAADDPTWGWRLPPPAVGTQTTFVVGPHVINAPDPRLEAGCLALAKGVDDGLLGIEFELAEEGPVFHTAVPTPDLRLGGDVLIEALADVFTPAVQEVA